MYKKRFIKILLGVSSIATVGTVVGGIVPYVISNTNIKRMSTKEKTDDAFPKSKKGNDEDNLNSLKTKFEKINSSQTISDDFDLDLANKETQKKVREFIFDKIDSKNKDNELTPEEKVAISLETNSGIITHSITKDINIKITFGSKAKVYTFKISRTESQDEINLDKFNKLKAKIDKVDLNWKIDEKTDLYTDRFDKNLFNVWKYINKFNKDAPLTSSEEKAISSFDSKFYAITLTPSLVNLKITFGPNTKIYPFQVTRTKSNKEKLNILKTKVTNYIKNYGTKIFLIDSSIDNINHNINRIKIRKVIIDKINNKYSLNEEEKKGVTLMWWARLVKSNSYLKVKFDFVIDNLRFSEYFDIKRAKNNYEIETENFNKIKRALNNEFYINKDITLDTQRDFNLSDQTQKAKLMNKITDSIEGALFNLDYNDDYFQKDNWIDKLSIANDNINISTSYSKVKLRVKFPFYKAIFFNFNVKREIEDSIKLYNLKYKFFANPDSVSTSARKIKEITIKHNALNKGKSRYTILTTSSEFKDAFISSFNSQHSQYPISYKERSHISFIKRDWKNLSSHSNYYVFIKVYLTFGSSTYTFTSFKVWLKI